MIKGILGGLKFSILGFFWLGKLSKYFSFLVPWFIQFLGGRVVGYIQNSLKISVAVLLVVMVSVTFNLEILTRRT